MRANRLQLTLIPDPRQRAQPLPHDVRIESVEIIAMMLVRLIRAERVNDNCKEARNESR